MSKKKNCYVDYDYENLYDLENKLLWKIDEHLVKQLNKGMVYATKEVYAGEQLEVEVYPEFTKKQLEELEKKNKVKKEIKDKNNDKKARKEFTRLANHNFHNGDYWLTLTYSNENYPADIDEAVKNMHNYIRRVNRARKKEGLDNAKYMYVTEWKEGKNGVRCHHHILINKGLGMDKLEELWTKGRRNQVRKLKKDEYGLTGMANYLTKSPQGKKRWCSSRNLEKPVVRKNHYKFKRSKVNKIVQDFRGTICQVMESMYKNYIFTDSKLYLNEYNNGFYIYTRMRRKE